MMPSVLNEPAARMPTPTHSTCNEDPFSARLMGSRIEKGSIHAVIGDGHSERRQKAVIRMVAGKRQHDIIVDGEFSVAQAKFGCWYCQTTIDEMDVSLSINSKELDGENIQPCFVLVKTNLQ